MIISKTRKIILIFLYGIFLQSCATNGIPEGEIVDHYLNDCSKKINGVMVPIRCPINEQPILSTDQRLDSLERFKDFLEGSKYEVALQLSEQLKFENPETDYYIDGGLSYNNPLVMISGEKFIIQLYFRNYMLFPTKYYDQLTFRVDKTSNREMFQTDTSQEFTNKWTDIIFTRYLGGDYERFQPQLGIVHDRRVGIRLLISEYSELEEVIYRDPIYRIRHIGDPEIIEEIIVD